MSNWFKTFFDPEYVSQLRDQKHKDTTREVQAVIKALRLPRGARILDVACGFGRHSYQLARRGYNVVGLDFSRAMLAEARRQSLGQRLTFLRGDMRCLDFKSEFDGVINLFTSFGYFSRKDNERALLGMARALRPGGRIVIDTPDRDYQDRHIVTRYWSVIGKRYVLEDVKYDQPSGRIRSAWHIIQPGRRRILHRSFELYLHNLSQWKAMFHRVGLRFLRAYGGYNLSMRRPGITRRLIVVGERR